MHREGEPMNSKGKSLLLWGLLGLSIIILVLNLLTMPTSVLEDRVIFSRWEGVLSGFGHDHTGAG